MATRASRAGWRAKRAVVVGAGQTAGRDDRQRPGHRAAVRPPRCRAAAGRPRRGVGRPATRDRIVGRRRPGRDPRGRHHRRGRPAPPSSSGPSTVLGRIDVLHNNVGIGAGDGPTDRTRGARPGTASSTSTSRPCGSRASTWCRRCANRAAAPSSTSRRWPPIAAASTLTAYKVSKAGVNALTQTLAVAHARDGIRVNAIMPGLIDTPMAVDASRPGPGGRPRRAGRGAGPSRATRPPGHRLGRRPRRAVPGL